MGLNCDWRTEFSVPQPEHCPWKYVLLSESKKVFLFRASQVLHQLRPRDILFPPDGDQSYLQDFRKARRLLDLGSGIFESRSTFLHLDQSEFRFLRLDQSFLRFFGEYLKIGFSKMLLYIPWRFRKAGRVWCRRARETRRPRVTIGKIISKRETTENLSAFQDLGGIKISIKLPVSI